LFAVNFNHTCFLERSPPTYDGHFLLPWVLSVLLTAPWPLGRVAYRAPSFFLSCCICLISFTFAFFHVAYLAPTLLTSSRRRFCFCPPSHSHPFSPLSSNLIRRSFYTLIVIDWRVFPVLCCNLGSFQLAKTVFLSFPSPFFFFLFAFTS